MAFISTPTASHGVGGWLPHAHRLRPAGVGTRTFAAVERVAKHTSTASAPPYVSAVLKAGGPISMSQGDGDGASEAKAPRRVGRKRGVGGRGGAARNVNATSRDGLKRSKGQRGSDMIP